MAEEDPRIRLVSHERRRGLGGCIKTGFASASGELVLYTDADLPCDLAELAKACRLLRYHDAAHRGRVPARPHRRGDAPRRLLVLLQLAHPAQLRLPPARRELLVQALPPLDLRPDPPGERELVHRRRAHGAGAPARATTRCSSGSTTSPARAASRRCPPTPCIVAMVREMVRMRPQLRRAGPPPERLVAAEPAARRGRSSSSTPTTTRSPGASRPASCAATARGS